MPFSLEKLMLPFLWRQRPFTTAKVIQKSSLYVSVGHTAHSQVNSGIQRVTRSIAKEVLRRYEDSDLLEWFLEQDRFILLDEVAREKLSRFSGPPHEGVDAQLEKERETLFSLISEANESILGRLYRSVSSGEGLANYRGGESFQDRLKVDLILKFLRKCWVHSQELEREEETSRAECARELWKQMKEIRTDIGSVLKELGKEEGDYLDEANSSKLKYEYRIRAEEVVLKPLLEDPFVRWALTSSQTEALTGHFERLVGQLDRSEFRALKWVSFLPVPQAARRALRRCIRKFDNSRKQSSDRRLIRSFIAKVVRVRLTLDRFRSKHQRRLDLKSDWDWYLLKCLIEYRRMFEDSIETGEVEGIKRCIEKVGRLRHRLFPRRFILPIGSWILIPELMTSTELENVFSFVRKHGLKAAVVFHDALPVQFPELVSKRYREDHERYMRAIAQADCILPVSEYSKACYLDWAKGSGVDVPQIEVCLNGVQFREKSVEMDVRRLPEGVRDHFALCVSTMEPRKNHLKLLEAWRNLLAEGEALPQLVLVGNTYSGFEELAESVNRICKEERGIVWLKGVSDEDLETLYARCCFTVFPSIAEGFGLPILESLWYGTPCLCASFGAMEEVARGGGCVRVDMRDVEAMETGIRKIAFDAPLVASLEIECSKRKMRTWSDYAAQVGQILGFEAPN